jgi:hypothetical protein
VSAEWSTHPRRRGSDAVGLPCGHEVALEGPPILIEMSAAILEHQSGCRNLADDWDLAPGPRPSSIVDPPGGTLRYDLA